MQTASLARQTWHQQVATLLEHSPAIDHRTWHGLWLGYGSAIAATRLALITRSETLSPREAQAYQILCSRHGD